MKEALYFEAHDDAVVCRLCPHNCSIKEDKVGVCTIRKNVKGRLIALSYGQATGLALDPIEKKPLYHFHPGTPILSLGPNGCNFRCLFCQNWHISQVDSPTHEMTPEQVVRVCQQKSSVGIAFTYSEPLIWYEFVKDTAELAHKAGLVNVLVTNGYINQEPLRELLPFIDAMNVDVKSMDEEFYKKYCGGQLQPVLDTVQTAVQQCHVEITNLIIPTLNDTADHFERLAAWVADLSPHIPIHFSRYFPHYRLDLHPTPEKTLRTAREIALRHLHYVFLGNLLDRTGNSSYCPACRKPLIARVGYRILEYNIKKGCCSACGEQTHIPGT